ncbi:MAG: murein L,D-transpeptidase catalytic domain family protein [Bacteroidales bacterium]|nr:murein L,D-transpeptidase catalytic domain family protein [Bacteroidales bacterium]
MLCLTTFHPILKEGRDESHFIAGNNKTVIAATELLYQHLSEPALPLAALKSSIDVYRQLTKEGQIINDKVITIIDFTKPSHLERLFVIDLVGGKIIYKSLVAHGKNSGEDYATSFSNNPESHQSSLGYYLTGKSYVGRHGKSLLLNGLEKGINDNARKRAVVIHGAEYVSQGYIESNGKLGRSYGCPALPEETASEIINTIQEESLLFIYSSDRNYCKNSSFSNSFSSIP